MIGGVPHEVAWGQGRFAYLREHPEEEFRGLLKEAGFALARVVPTASLVSIVVAAPS